MAANARPFGRPSAAATSKIRFCHASPDVGRVAGVGERAEIAPLVVVEPEQRLDRRVLADGDDRPLRRVGLEPGPRGADPLVEDRRLPLRQRLALLRLDPGRDVDVRDLGEQREMAEGRPERLRLRRDVRVRIQQRVGERARVAGRQVALDRLAGGRGGELVELVEEARHGVGPLGVEVDRVVRARAQEEEPELLGRDDLDDLVGGRAAPLGRRHLLAADVDELVRDVQRRLPLEDLAGDRVAPVARPAGGREVLAARLDRDAEAATTGRPIRGSTAASPRRRTAPPGPSSHSRSPRSRGSAGTRSRPSGRPSPSRTSSRSGRSSGR